MHVLDTEGKPLTIGQKIRVFFISGTTMLATVIHLDNIFQIATLQFSVEGKYCQHTELDPGKVAEAFDDEASESERILQTMYKARALVDHYEEQALTYGPDSTHGSIFKQAADHFRTVTNMLGDPETLPAV